MRLWDHFQYITSRCVVSICTFTGLLYGNNCNAGYWIPITIPSNIAEGMCAPLLLTNGNVLCEGIIGGATGNIWMLTPDAFGGYINGTWSLGQSLQLLNGNEYLYAPHLHAGAVLPSGDVVFIGGKYNGPGAPVWTNQGVYYTVAIHHWSPLTAPSFFPSQIGNAQSVVLPNGTLMVASPSNTQAALFNASTKTWTAAHTQGKLDNNSEEGWTLLPNGYVLTIDCGLVNGLPPTTAEYFNYVSGGWTQTGTTGTSLSNLAGKTGAAILLANGNVFAIGASGNTAFYNYLTNTWTAGPSLPIVDGQQLGQSKGTAALLPNGNILIAASPVSPSGYSAPPVYIFEYDGINFVRQQDMPISPYTTSANINMLLLPNGEVLVTTGTQSIFVYVPIGISEEWQPHITALQTQLTPGTTYPITGVLFNGMSQGAMFGSDYQSATNYPLVRITNGRTNHVFYCLTSGHSSMAVAAMGVPVHTNFTVPSNIETGNSILEVVANGIPSPPYNVTISSP